MLCINYVTHLALAETLNWGTVFLTVNMESLKYELPESWRGLNISSH